MSSENSLIEKGLYFVAVKLFLRDGSKLLITHDIFGSWDLPGGRIKNDEFMTSLEDVIARKVSEELGPDISYALKSPKVFFRVERIEKPSEAIKVRIFAIGYEAEYKSGAISLGKHHDKMEWVDYKSFVAEDYFTGGWLTGVKEYQNL